MEKMQHTQRQEAAQQRREDKIKAAKEKMLTETDPDKQRKMEVCINVLGVLRYKLLRE